MSWLLAVVLLVAAIFMLQAGLDFVALLLFMVAVLTLFTGGGRKAHAAQAAQQQRPIIVTSSGGAIPDTIKVRIKPKWGGTDTWEDFATETGNAFSMPFKVVARLMGKRPKR